jgi:hypothetical protein
MLSNMSSETRPIKVTIIDPETIRANKIAIENSKTGKVTAVVAVIYLFRETKCNLRRANPKSRKKPSQEMDKISNFLMENSHNLRKVSQKSRKEQFSKKKVPNLKK